MTRLADLAAGVRSSNAGASRLTFDVIFDDEATWQRVVDSGRVGAAPLAALLGMALDDVRVYYYRPALAIKVTIPRGVLAGNPEDTDIDGKQQHVPLLSIDIP